MKFAAMVMALVVGVGPALAADDQDVAQLALCRASWLDWKKGDPERLEKFGAHFQSGFSRDANHHYFVPKANTTVAGLRVVQVYPESVGMGVGFSITVDATFDKAKARVQQTFGTPLKHCETGDGMRMCELEIAPMRTFMLMAGESEKDQTTLLGCYYLYEK